MAGKPGIEPFWTADIVAQACQVTGTYGANVEAQWPILFKIAGLYNLHEREVLACMCGVIGHETAGHWWPVHEGFGQTAAYAAKYGVAPSGQCYGGHGLIQTTWKNNHEIAMQVVYEKTGVKYDLVNYPHLILDDPILAAHCACVYWTTHAGGVLIEMSRALNYGEVIHYVWGAKLPGNQYYDQYYKRLSYAANYLMAR